MLTTPLAQPAERRLSAVDVFCMQTYQPASRDPLQRARGIAVTLGLMCLILLASLGFAVWCGNAVERERDVLALETHVRGDIVDETMQEQERRSAELEQLAEKVERDKLARANCVTPRSILAASDL
jgi:hypothetical protein